MVMTMRMGMTMAVGGQPVTVDLPAMNMTMHVDTRGVSPEGNCTYAFELVEADVEKSLQMDPMVAQEMRTSLQSIVGMSGTAVVTRRGITTEATYDLPPNADPSVRQTMDSMKQQMDQMSAPLPEEPVGIGARWKVFMPIESQGLTIRQTATYELLGFEGSTAQLGVTLVQAGDRQHMDLPDLPPGTSAELNWLESEGHGSMELDLTRLVPKTRMDLAMDMSSVIRAEGEEVDMTMSMTLGMTIDPRPRKGE
jgi:hypothetical protein